MTWQRVGLVPHTDHPDAQHLHRSAVVVSRDASELPRYGRAVLGMLTQPVGYARLAEVGAVVIWGGDDEAVARVMVQQPAALVLLVLPRKPRKDSHVLASAARLVERGIDVDVRTITGKAKGVQAVDVGTDKQVVEVTDLRRPPQQQAAPSTPRPEVEPWVHSAPGIPRPKVVHAKHSAPSIRVETTSAPAPAAKPTQVD